MAVFLTDLARLRDTKTKVRRVLIHELLFAEDATVAIHSEEALRRLRTYFIVACSEFALTIHS